MKEYEIFYNDGVYAGRIEFYDCAEEYITNYLLMIVDDFNQNPNKDYHITLENISPVIE